MRFSRTYPRDLVPLGLMVVVFITACGSDDSEQVGDDPSAEAEGCPVGIDRYEGNDTAVLLGCTELADRTEVELLAGGPNGGAGPCLYISGMGQGRARGCGLAPLERGPPQTGAILTDGTAQPTPKSQIEVYGGLSAEATTVQLWYGIEDSGAAPQTEAAVIRVDSAPALERAGIAEAFGYFIGVVPARAEGCVAVALNSHGDPIGADGCEPYGGLAPDAFIARPDYRASP